MVKRAPIVRAAPRLADLDRFAQQAIAKKGCSAVAIALATLDKQGRLVPRHLSTYGLASLPPPPIRLAPAARFDLGALTGGLCTSLIALQWVSKNRLDLQRPLGAVLPAASKGPLASIPLSTLLDHTSGIGPQTDALRALLAACPKPEREAVRSATQPAPLAPHLPKAVHWREVAALGGPLPPQAHQTLVAGLCQLTPESAFGQKEAYSPVNLLLLGLAIEAMAGAPLDQVFVKDVATPLRLPPEVQFVRCGPQGPHKRLPSRPGEAHAVATANCPYRRRAPQGEPGDLLAYLLGGIAGHQGLFSSLNGALLLAGPLLLASRGTASPLHQATLNRFLTRSKRTHDARFALGWEIACRDNGMAPGRWHPRTVGLLCPSGQALFLDPGFGVLGILLTNWGVGREKSAEPDPAFDAFRLRVFDAMASLA